MSNLAVEISHGLLPWIEIPDIEDKPHIFADLHSGPGIIPDDIVASEKIHGNLILLTYIPKFDELLVSCGGLWNAGLILSESGSSMWSDVVNKYNIKQTLREISAIYPFADTLGMYGEIYGNGIKDLGYGEGDKAFIVLDILFTWNEAHLWIDQAQIHSLMGDLDTPQRVAPIVYSGIYSYESLCDLAEGYEEVSGELLHVCEGLVVRSNLYDGKRQDGPFKNRPIAKFINAQFTYRGRD